MWASSWGAGAGQRKSPPRPRLHGALPAAALRGEEEEGGAGGPYLGRVVQVEGLVEAEVDEAQQGGVELGEGGHDPVVHVCRVLGAQEVCRQDGRRKDTDTHAG